MDEPKTVKNFLDGMNRILEKESTEALKQSEFVLKAELLPERNPVGQSFLWFVRDEEGRTMLWMIPQQWAKQCAPGKVVTAKGYPVLWPSTKQGKRLEWLQVREIDFSVIEPSRTERARELARRGLVGWHKHREWPIDSSRGSVKVHIVASSNNNFLPRLRHLFLKGRRFIVIEQFVDMNEAPQVAKAIEEATYKGGDFLLLLQQEEDNICLFDQPLLLEALKKTTLYTYLIQPQERVRPFGAGWVDKWMDNPIKAAQGLIRRCWQIWKGPKDKVRLREVVTAQAEKDRRRLAQEISRLRRENEELQETVATIGPRKVAELEEKLEAQEQELQKREERRRIIDEQLFLLEQEKEELLKKVALLEAGGLVPKEPLEQEKEIEKVRRQEEFRRTLLEEESDRLKKEVKSLQQRLQEASPLRFEELKEEKTALSQELGRSEERREQLAEFLFILEQENRELRGRLGFREDIDGVENPDKANQDEEGELVLGKVRLYEEIHDLLVKEEIERMQREIKRLQELLAIYSPVAMATLEEELQMTKEQLQKSESMREKLRQDLMKLQKETGQNQKLKKKDKAKAARPTLLELTEEEKVDIEKRDTEKTEQSDNMENLLDKTFSLFRQGLRWNRKKE
ncbi:hypothetical protein [Heliorestis convoluta]|uniref:Uncharacterized protein n=1 Tax=Heliorestis convoluta TaxID=356322 RepID=A0A5Q2N518_9FIRM|nr:hypothetical protein [Heliorestis convoluta]QGG49033.1 hypothetical protein FTV88_2944 [Heliorestis convoluta]